MKGKNILILEDDISYGTTLKTIFEHHGYTVFYAEQAEKALEIAEQEKPSIIISDVVMFPVDGITFIKKLRLLGSYGARVPCFLYTHSKKETLQQDTQHLSISHIYNKDEVSPEQLFENISLSLT